jgi:hypothetical protein
MIQVDFCISRHRDPAVNRLAVIGHAVAVGVTGPDLDADGRPVIWWAIIATERAVVDHLSAELLAHPAPRVIGCRITTSAWPSHDDGGDDVWFDCLIGCHAVRDFPAAAALDWILTHGERVAVSALDHVLRRF